MQFWFLCTVLWFHGVCAVEAPEKKDDGIGNMNMAAANRVVEETPFRKTPTNSNQCAVWSGVGYFRTIRKIFLFLLKDENTKYLEQMFSGVVCNDHWNAKTSEECKAQEMVEKKLVVFVKDLIKMTKEKLFDDENGLMNVVENIQSSLFEEAGDAIERGAIALTKNILGMNPIPAFMAWNRGEQYFRASAVATALIEHSEEPVLEFSVPVSNFMQQQLLTACDAKTYVLLAIFFTGMEVTPYVQKICFSI